MNQGALTTERILDAAEQMLRRHGPRKTTVLDVARALDVSHGSIYRHFASKEALREAVAERWLRGVSAPLEAIAAEDGAAADRLHRWLTALMVTKRRKVLEDQELFAAYQTLAAEARDVIGAHVQHLVSQIERIIRDGVARGEFVTDDPAAAACAVLDATARFHHPAHAEAWTDPGIDAAFASVWRLVLGGLSAGAANRPPAR